MQGNREIRNNNENILNHGIVITLKDIQEFEQNLENNAKIKSIISKVIDRINKNETLVQYKPKSIVQQISVVYNTLIQISKIYKLLSFESVKDKEKAMIQYINSMFFSYYIHGLKYNNKK